MTDPLSITAGAAGLLSLGIQVSQSLFTFYSDYKNQSTDAAQTSRKLENILIVLQSLRLALQNPKPNQNDDDLIQAINRSILDCTDIIAELEDEWEKIAIPSGVGIKDKIKATSRRVTYAFRKSTFERLNEDISELRNNLSFALEVLHLVELDKVHDDISESRVLLEHIRASQISSIVRDWLDAPDVTINHNAAIAKRHTGTGLWFVNGSRFATWLSDQNSFIWLNGFAGCGKSVLCSTAIQYTFRRMNQHSGIGIAFFYFSFSDHSKRDESAMIRAVLLQLAGQNADCQGDLVRLHSSYKSGLPPPEVLLECLRHMICRLKNVYILVDALDESPRYEAREGVLRTIDTIRKWGLPCLHLLVTSRDSVDIRRSLDAASEEDLILRNDGINDDINNLISFQLETNPGLQKWQGYHDQIHEALNERSEGIFRYVECQFDTLKRCPRTKNHLSKCLQSLPRGLDETYERILCDIEEDYLEDARQILTLLCFSTRPLTVEELIHGYAVDLTEPPHLDLEGRLLDTESLSEICPGLIEVIHDESSPTSNPIVRIAHFSVKEYLESDRIKKQKASMFAMDSEDAHALVVQTCLVYLSEPALVAGLSETKLLEFPLALYAAEFWYTHYEMAKNRRARFENLILSLFMKSEQSFYTWVRIYNVEEPWRSGPDFGLASSAISSQVYYASLLGLDWVLQALLDDITDNESRKRLVNSQGGYFGYALPAASCRGHEKVVEILLNSGADVNAHGGPYGNALQAASYYGHEKVVQKLLSHGAEGGALREASYNGQEKVVRMLIDMGVDINAQNGQYGNALQAASFKGHEEIVQVLLDNGAEINAQGGHFSNAFQAASYGGHEKLVLLLLSKGADMHAHGKRYGNALQAASYNGQAQVVQILIKHGADVNAQGGPFGNALQAASYRGHENVVEVLIDNGADIDAEGEYFNNAIEAAAHNECEKVVQILLSARVNKLGIQE